jgi:tRNA threonylcarbamoyladenosine biosynthesis protein TsaB
MKVLALDGALGGFSVAFLSGKTLVSEFSGQPDALESGLARVARVLERAGTNLAAIDRFAVGIGPGSFTGVRIAVSYAKALAFARGRPLVGISSYAILTPAGAEPPVLTVVQGRRGIVLARLADGTSTTCASGPPDEVIAALLDGRTIDELTLAGNTEDVHSAVAERRIVVRAPFLRAEHPAAAVARLALHATPGATPHAVAPDYGELPAVTMRAPT